MVPAVWGSEFRAVVHENDSLILDVNKHIGLTITGDIAKFQGHGREVAARVEKIRAAVADSLCRIARHKFHDDDMAMQVDSDKVAGMRGIITMTNHSVGLERARITVAYIVVSRQAPGQC